MLLDKGDFLAFERLNSEAVFGKDDRPAWRPRTIYRYGAGERDWSPSGVRFRSRLRSPGALSKKFHRQYEELDVYYEDEEPPPRKGPPTNQGPREDSRHREAGPLVVRQRDIEVDQRRRPSPSPPPPLRGPRVIRDREYPDLLPSPPGNRRSWITAQVCRDRTREVFDYDELELLRNNWRLLRATSAIHRKGNLHAASVEASYTIDRFQFGTRIGSTEARIAFAVLLSAPLHD